MNWVILTREETASSSLVGRFPLTTGEWSAKREREGKRAFFSTEEIGRHRRRIRRKSFWADVTCSLNSPCSAAWCCCVCVYIGRSCEWMRTWLSVLAICDDVWEFWGSMLLRPLLFLSLSSLPIWNDSKMIYKNETKTNT